MATKQLQDEAGFLQSKYPVYFPSHPALALNDSDFEQFVATDIKLRDDPVAEDLEDPPDDEDEADTTTETGDKMSPVSDATKSFMEAILAPDDGDEIPEEEPNLMFTDKGGISHKSTEDSLADLFSGLSEGCRGKPLYLALGAAWASDPLATLKIIFNARSIHLGKASRNVFYTAAGWLAVKHPLTLVGNLQWLSRPIIKKKVVKADKDEQQKTKGKPDGGGDDDDDDDEAVLIDPKDLGDDAAGDDGPERYDVKNGVPHGYWKDLLNLLVLAVRGELNGVEDPVAALNVPRQTKKRKRSVGESRDEKDDHARTKKTPADLHSVALRAFDADPVYRAMYLTVARLFADQLRKDIAALRGDDEQARKRISLCGKWAPSTKLFHDRHTFVASTVAELMHPRSEFASVLADAPPSLDEHGARELYLRHAREAYRKDVSALRRYLDVVERHISKKEYGSITYERIPSLAMNRYTSLFGEKDGERFAKYLAAVAAGEVNISGAVMAPSVLVEVVRPSGGQRRYGSSKAASRKAMIESKVRELKRQVADGQWKTLVKRIKDSGSLSDSMAVCDTSGSMYGPALPDGTTPIDSAIGLSLLIASVTKPPFGGAFITFSEKPKVVQVALDKPFSSTVADMERASWGGTTNFVSVFKNLILPMAVKHKVRREDMVKRLFVFSDMQFDSAQASGTWDTNYQIVKKAYDAAGYDVPELVFWNLAYGGSQPKPVTKDDVGTCLVSGYSQAMLKVFLDGGQFGDDEMVEEIVEEEDEDGVMVEKTEKKVPMNPVSVVKKAIGHPAYAMLKVLD